MMMMKAIFDSSTPPSPLLNPHLLLLSEAATLTFTLVMMMMMIVLMLLLMMMMIVLIKQKMMMAMKAMFDSNAQFPFPSSPLVRRCLPDFTLVPILPFCSSASWPNIIFDYLPSFAFCVVRFPDPLADGSGFFKVRRGPCLHFVRL